MSCIHALDVSSPRAQEDRGQIIATWSRENWREPSVSDGENSECKTGPQVCTENTGVKKIK